MEASGSSGEAEQLVEAANRAGFALPERRGEDKEVPRYGTGFFLARLVLSPGFHQNGFRHGL